MPKVSPVFVNLEDDQTTAPDCARIQARSGEVTDIASMQFEYVDGSVGSWVSLTIDDTPMPVIGGVPSVGEVVPYICEKEKRVALLGDCTFERELIGECVSTAPPPLQKGNAAPFDTGYTLELSYDETTFAASYTVEGSTVNGTPSLYAVSLEGCVAGETIWSGVPSIGCGLTGGAGQIVRDYTWDWDGNFWAAVYEFQVLRTQCEGGVTNPTEYARIGVYRNDVLVQTFNVVGNQGQTPSANDVGFQVSLSSNGNDVWMEVHPQPTSSLGAAFLGNSIAEPTMRFIQLSGGSAILDTGIETPFEGGHMVSHPDGGFWWVGAAGLILYHGPLGTHILEGLDTFSAFENAINHLYPNGDVHHTMNTVNGSRVLRATENGIFAVDYSERCSLSFRRINPQVQPDFSTYILRRSDTNWPDYYRGRVEGNTSLAPIITPLSIP